MFSCLGQQRSPYGPVPSHSLPLENNNTQHLSARMHLTTSTESLKSFKTLRFSCCYATLVTQFSVPFSLACVKLYNGYSFIYLFISTCTPPVILTDEEVQRKKDLIQRRKDEEAQREAEREARRPRLTDEQSQVISTLVEAHHKTYDDSYSDFRRFRVCISAQCI